jgi:hypothetical protein
LASFNLCTFEGLYNSFPIITILQLSTSSLPHLHDQHPHHITIMHEIAWAFVIMIISISGALILGIVIVIIWEVYVLLFRPATWSLARKIHEKFFQLIKQWKIRGSQRQKTAIQGPEMATPTHQAQQIPGQNQRDTSIL